VYFIQKEHSAIRLLQESFPVSVGTGIGSLSDSKDLRYKKLRVICIIRTVKSNEGCIGSYYSGFCCELVHQLGKHGLSYTGSAQNQGVQSVRRIQNSCFCLLYRYLKALVDHCNFIQAVFSGWYVWDSIACFILRGAIQNRSAVNSQNLLFSVKPVQISADICPVDIQPFAYLAGRNPALCIILQFEQSLKHLFNFLHTDPPTAI